MLWIVLCGSHSGQSRQFLGGECRHCQQASRLSLCALNPGHPEMGPDKKKNNFNALLITDILNLLHIHNIEVLQLMLTSQASQIHRQVNE